MRRIYVFWSRGTEKVRIGELVEASGSPIMFEWDKTFLLSDIELSPLKFPKIPGLIECPIEPFGGLPGLFADSIPDGWGRILLKIGLDKKGLGSDEFSPLDAMAYIGDRAIGALSFEPRIENSECWAEGKISLRELEAGITPILEGSVSAVIETFLQNGASPNGIRPKIILKEKNGVFYSTMDEIVADEWIIKFKAKEDPTGIGKLEYIYSLMAQSAGLEMPETKLFESGGRQFFGVKRFDREKSDRVHVHTLSGILHAAPGNFSVGYEHFAKVAQHLTNDVREVEKVFRIAAFNVFSCNEDDHSKNVAFLMDKNGKWKVAPAYDLTFHRTKFSEHKMALNGNGKPTEKDLIEFGETFGFSTRKIYSIIEQVKSSLAKFEKIAKRLELPKSQMEIVQDCLDKILNKSSRK